IVNIIKLNESNIEKLLSDTEKMLKEGGVAIVPTDTVYGLVCDGLNEKAKDRIFEIKGRSENKPLIGFVDSIGKVKQFAEILPENISLLEKSWPGAVTVVLKAKTNLYRITSGEGKTAFRIPGHKFLLMLIKRFDMLASTSANISGGKTPSRIEDIPDIVKEKADIVIDGGVLPGNPSEIWDITGKAHIQLR
ncbi:MAG: threonylcarbamoyl-AMP synthase, partial [Candidatus Omnitrophica bacterium]|nr:threonylcarbamoyl-AMP synthase [Candidatus Omnitrophota bacterium]